MIIFSISQKLTQLFFNFGCVLEKTVLEFASEHASEHVLEKIASEFASELDLEHASEHASDKGRR